jgi:hypothetical protein
MSLRYGGIVVGVPESCITHFLVKLILGRQLHQEFGRFAPRRSDPVLILCAVANAAASLRGPDFIVTLP